MRTVHKYPLAAGVEQPVEMPQGAEILTVAFQGDNLVLWAKVDTDSPLRQRTFAVYGTGHPIPQKAMEYIGTAHLVSLGFYFHVFEIR